MNTYTPNYKYVIDRDSLIDLRVVLCDLIDRVKEDLDKTTNKNYLTSKINELNELKNKTQYINLETIKINWISKIPRESP